MVEIGKDVLDESDGTMLMHGLEGCHNVRLAVVPNSNSLKSNKEFLEDDINPFEWQAGRRRPCRGPAPDLPHEGSRGNWEYLHFRPDDRSWYYLMYGTTN